MADSALSLYHQFAVDKNIAGILGPAFTFSRAGGAWVNRPDGTITWGDENLILQSNNFTDAAWLKNGLATVTDGDLLQVGPSIADDNVRQTATGATPSSTRLEYSFKLKAVSTSGTLKFTTGAPTLHGEWEVDLSQISTTAFELINRDHAAVTVNFEFISDGIGLAVTEFGTVAAEVLQFRVQDLQLNRGGVAHTYQETTSSQFFGPRFQHDNISLDSLGLLVEPSATSLSRLNRDLGNAISWLLSNMTGVKDATGIDGVPSSATTLTATAANGSSLQPITAGFAPYVFSIYVKRKTGTGDIQISDNNGTNWTTLTGLSSSFWTRHTLSRLQSNPFYGIRIVTSGDEVEVDLAQIELDSGGKTMPSSPIETAFVNVTRTADVVNLTDMSFLDTAATAIGTWYYKGRFNSAGLATQPVFTLNDGSVNDQFKLEVDGSQNANFRTTNSVDTDGRVLGTGVISAFTEFNVGASYADDDIAMAVDNVLETEDTTAGIPLTNNPTTLTLERGMHAELRYYNVQKSDTFITQLSNDEILEIVVAAAGGTYSGLRVNIGIGI